MQCTSSVERPDWCKLLFTSCFTRESFFFSTDSIFRDFSESNFSNSLSNLTFLFELAKIWILISPHQIEISSSHRQILTVLDRLISFQSSNLQIFLTLFRIRLAGKETVLFVFALIRRLCPPDFLFLCGFYNCLTGATNQNIMKF